jgi:uncharacterized protein YcaQ
MNWYLASRKLHQTQDEYTDKVPLSPDEWENRLIAKSFKVVEARIDNGTATAAELVHFLKAGSAKQREEMEKLREENALLRAKTSAIEYEKDRSVSYREVLDALTSYRTETTDVPFNPVIYRVD